MRQVQVGYSCALLRSDPHKCLFNHIHSRLRAIYDGGNKQPVILKQDHGLVANAEAVNYLIWVWDLQASQNP